MGLEAPTPEIWDVPVATLARCDSAALTIDISPSGEPQAARKKMSDRACEREPFKESVARATADLITNPDDALPRSSDDEALTAFAQLGALRLRARRCAISFFDRKTQYVLAEATKTLSLQTNIADDPKDGLLWGVSQFPRGSGICQHTVCLPLEFVEASDGQRTEVAVSIIPDMAKDDRFCDLPFVDGATPTRFYAGVPIRSPSGLSLGSYCVMDDHPRESLDPGELSFLKDMATTVMVHLEMVRAREEVRRNELVMHGLGSFIEGERSAWAWRGKSSNPVGDQTPSPKWYDKQYAMQRVPTPKPGKDDTTIMADRSIPGQPAIESTKKSPPLSQESLMPLEKGPIHLSKTANRQNSLKSLNVRQTFARAASIIRECTDVDGVLLYDASVGTHGGMVGFDSESEHSETSMSDNPASLENTNPDMSSDSASETGGKKRSSEEPPKLCNILGFATPERSTLQGDEPLDVHKKMTEALIHKLLKRYPLGRVFHCDERGVSPTNLPRDAVTHTSDSTEKQRGRSNHRLRRSDADAIRQILPGVRSMILIPLYDITQKRMYAGGVIWTTDPQRIFSREQSLTYLAAFADSIMAEVARINARISDQTKSDFISSICEYSFAHELRSPLHGILGSIEYLQETEVAASQVELLQTIETCGTTLLDTIDHLLDYAKINNFARSTKALDINERDTGISQTSIGSSTQSSLDLSKGHGGGLERDVNLAKITQEVVQTVRAGFDYMTSAGNGRQRLLRSSTQPDEHASRHANNTPLARSYASTVPVHVDIDEAADAKWLFRIQAGAWRRVVINLLGNALKYTTEGYVRVKLREYPLSASNRSGENSRSKVVLTVIDTGVGMSKDFLDTKLFTPFVQEDTHKPGVGLGMSIIKQIVTNLGGSINVQSERGKGTQMEVQVDLPRAPSAAKATNGLPRDLSAVNAATTRNVVASMVAATSSAEQGQSEQPASSALHSLEVKPDLDFDVSVVEIQPDIPRVISRRATDPHTAESLHDTPLADRTVGNTSSGRKRVLLVDDNNVNLQLLVRYMKKQGYIYRTATNGLEALEAFRACTDPEMSAMNGGSRGDGEVKLDGFDYVLMDISMPLMDGLESTRRIRAHERSLQMDQQVSKERKPTTIIALTGLASAQAQQEAYSSGVDLFVTKPIKLAELAKVLQAGGSG